MSRTIVGEEDAGRQVKVYVGDRNYEGIIVEAVNCIVLNTKEGEVRLMWNSVDCVEYLPKERTTIMAEPMFPWSPRKDYKYKLCTIDDENKNVYLSCRYTQEQVLADYKTLNEHSHLEWYIEKEK